MAVEATGETSMKTRACVEYTLILQSERSGQTSGRMASQGIKEYCRLDGKCQELLKPAIAELNLSGRAYGRILRVAIECTIANLDRTVSLRRPGQKFSVRLVNVVSVRFYLNSQLEKTNNEG